MNDNKAIKLTDPEIQMFFAIWIKIGLYTNVFDADRSDKFLIMFQQFLKKVPVFYARDVDCQSSKGASFLAVSTPSKSI